MRRTSQAGFTFIETTLVAVIFVGLVGMFGRAFSTSDGVMRESRAALRANEDLRRNLDSIANSLRGASASSLANFAADSTSTAPSYKCVTGLDSTGACVLGAAQTLQWQADSGTSKPGRLVLVSGGVSTTIARGVPTGGFKAFLEGNSLRVQLSTRYTTARGNTTITGDVSVSLRN
jgi:type II secretory pathway pseudopilin PulG